jgi:hypothetical protein
MLAMFVARFVLVRCLYIFILIWAVGVLLVVFFLQILLGSGDLFRRLDLLSSSFGELAILDPERGIVVALTTMHA